MTFYEYPTKDPEVTFDDLSPGDAIIANSSPESHLGITIVISKDDTSIKLLRDKIITLQWCYAL